MTFRKGKFLIHSSYLTRNVNRMISSEDYGVVMALIKRRCTLIFYLVVKIGRFIGTLLFFYRYLLVVRECSKLHLAYIVQVIGT